jgi:CubicO group peptidase (beta-lactamase class C family)
MRSLPRSTPEAQGLTTTALDAFVAALDSSGQEVQTLMLVRHGHVVLEEEWAPYRLADPHLLFSISKSFTSMAVGLAVEAGLLSIDDTVVSFFDEELPDKISENLAAMRIRDLLTMTTGHHDDTIPRMREGDRMTRTFLSFDVEHEPGTHFSYNTGATYILSVILQRLTGEKLLDYLQPRLLEPLGATEATWPESAEGVTVGGWGLGLNTDSVARFGQFLLQKGEWEGRQLVPAEWIAAATAKQVSNANHDSLDGQQGYGYQFWRSQYGAYRADGAFGQLCLVLPEQDAVLVTTSAAAGQELLNLIWEHLPPALDGASASGTPKPSLEISPPSGPAPAANGRTYQFERNDHNLVAVRLDAESTFTLEVAGVQQDVTCAPGGWREAECTLPGLGSRVLTSAYGDQDAVVATLRFPETPYCYTLSCRPSAEELAVEVGMNVGFGPEQVTLTAHADCDH